MSTYQQLVAHDHIACPGRPLEWEGQLADGRHFYFRYRYGCATLGVGDTPAAAITDPDEVGVQAGGPYDGDLDDHRYQTLFVQLYARHPAGGAA
jgi:hypothetical protein